MTTSEQFPRPDYQYRAESIEQMQTLLLFLERRLIQSDLPIEDVVRMTDTIAGISKILAKDKEYNWDRFDAAVAAKQRTVAFELGEQR